MPHVTILFFFCCVLAIQLTENDSAIRLCACPIYEQQKKHCTRCMTKMGIGHPSPDLIRRYCLFKRIARKKNPLVNQSGHAAYKYDTCCPVVRQARLAIEIICTL